LAGALVLWFQGSETNSFDSYCTNRLCTTCYPFRYKHRLLFNTIIKEIKVVTNPTMGHAPRCTWPRMPSIGSVTTRRPALEPSTHTRKLDRQTDGQTDRQTERPHVKLARMYAVCAFGHEQLQRSSAKICRIHMFGTSRNRVS
jgi:hypothetical protein